MAIGGDEEEDPKGEEEERLKRLLPRVWDIIRLPPLLPLHLLTYLLFFISFIKLINPWVSFSSFHCVCITIYKGNQMPT